MRISPKASRCYTAHGRGKSSQKQNAREIYPATFLNKQFPRLADGPIVLHDIGVDVG